MGRAPVASGFPVVETVVWTSCGVIIVAFLATTFAIYCREQRASNAPLLEISRPATAASWLVLILSTTATVAGAFWVGFATYKRGRP